MDNHFRRIALIKLQLWHRNLPVYGNGAFLFAREIYQGVFHIKMVGHFASAF